MESYITIQQRSTFEYEDRKSIFIGEAMPVSTEDEALAFIESVKRTYPDARHHVYAYVLRENSIMRFTDDHEPQGTAGMPVLDVIRKNGLTDIVVVVTRYFGGTLLGAGGLVRAYGKAAALALENSGVSMLTPYYIVNARMPYSFLDPVRNTFVHYEITEADVEYGADVALKLQMPVERFEAFQKHITELTSALVVPEIESEKLVPKKIS